MGHSLCLLTASLLTAQVPQGGTVISTQYTTPYTTPYTQSPSPGCNCQQGNNAQASYGTSGRTRGWFRGANERCAQRPGLINRIKDRFGGDNQTQYANQMPSGQPQNAQWTRTQPTNASLAISPAVRTQPGVPAQLVGQPQPLTPAPLPTGPTIEPSTAPATTREPELAAPKSATPTAPAPAPATTPAGPKLSPISFRPATSSAATPTTATKMPLSRNSKIDPKFVDKVGHEDDYSWITGQLDQENGRWIIRYATPDTVDRFHGELPLVPGVNLNGLRAGDLVSATGQVLGQGDRTQYRVVAISLIERR